MMWLVLLFGSVLWAAPPLQIVSVGRAGLPPYTGSERVYRLEGSGCTTLRVGEILVLRREGDRRDLGRLEILTVHLDHAQARLATGGETFPLKGDLAVRTELLKALPELPSAPATVPVPDAARLRPLAIVRVMPRPVGTGAIQREPIYFLKGDASLSPGAQAKLKAWAETWGLQGQWSLECPQDPGMLSTLLESRISALRAELGRHGVARLEIKPAPPDPPGRYDAIYVMREPW